MPTTYAIPDGRTVMAATLYTGTGATQTISNSANGVSFQPDLVWVKGRSGATDHAWYDAVRGVQKQLESNTTTAETTETTGLTAFGSTGFTIGALAQMNTSAATYVGWQWNAGGSTVTNTSGSISAQVRANATAGFSVVTFTSTGSSGAVTVGHGLGVAPSMVITKERGAIGSWGVYHQGLTTPASQYLNLQTTGAATTNTSYWGNTNPSSTVVTLGNGTMMALNTTMVMYCFAAVAGYSAFGSYTGNGSADGPFVYLGFRPRFVMIKASSRVADWVVVDTSRSTYNVATAALYPNLSAAEDTGITIDILSNGFKPRAVLTNCNASGETYIYMAFAENPLKFANAR
jgi:hypothetical protein